MIKPTKTLPSGYIDYFSFDLSKNTRLIVVLNIASLGLFILFGWIFLRLIQVLRPTFTLSGEIRGNLVWALWIIASYLFVVVLHELIHGLFFWITTLSRPRFGFKGAYAFASAPDWYMPRNLFLVVGLAPLILITLVGIVLISVVPDAFVVIIWINLTANAAGAIGDILIVGWMLTQPRTILVRDLGDAFFAYRQEQA